MRYGKRFYLKKKTEVPKTVRNGTKNASVRYGLKFGRPTVICLKEYWFKFTLFKPYNESKYFELIGFEQNEVEEYLSKFYPDYNTLKEEQKKKIFDLASIENNKVLPLKLELIVNYLKNNIIIPIDELLNESNTIKRQHTFF